MTDNLSSISNTRNERPHTGIPSAASAIQPSLSLSQIYSAEGFSSLAGENVVRLDGEHVALYEAMPLLGPVSVSTGNHVAHLTRTGKFAKMGREGGVGLVLGKIDLRVFYSKWAYAFAVRHTQEGMPPAGFHFFDAHGKAITQILLGASSDLRAFEILLERHAAKNTDEMQKAFAPPEQAQPTAKQFDAVETEAFRTAWDAMTDPHEFFGLLHRFGISRIQAMRLARADQAHKLPGDTCRALFQDVVASGLPIMAFIGNAGQIQIHTGPISELESGAQTLLALSPDLALSLKTSLIAETWAVRKPSPDGTVTSIELYDAAGENIAMFFGARKPGHPELEDWRATVARLEAAVMQSPKP
jgi:putative hemin transport protein